MQGVKKALRSKSAIIEEVPSGVHSVNGVSMSCHRDKSLGTTRHQVVDTEYRDMIPGRQDILAIVSRYRNLAHGTTRHWVTARDWAGPSD